ncbi:hypothetical protein PMAYCL1PPCAC_19237, partial [Pristionchus mayeri]
LGSVVLSVSLLSDLLDRFGRDHLHLEINYCRSRNLFSDSEQHSVSTGVLDDDLLFGDRRRGLVDESALQVILMCGFVVDLHSRIHSERGGETLTRRDCLDLRLGYECSIQVDAGLSHQKRKGRGVDGGSCEEGGGILSRHLQLQSCRHQFIVEITHLVVSSVRGNRAGTSDVELGGESLRVHCS